jgi:hypothetical protein
VAQWYGGSSGKISTSGWEGLFLSEIECVGYRSLLMNRRQFITAAIGAAVVPPALPKVAEYSTFLLPEKAIVYGLSPVEVAWHWIRLYNGRTEHLIKYMSVSFEISKGQER